MANARTNDCPTGDEPATDSQRYLTVRGRRWRRTDPRIPEDLRSGLVSALGRARSAVRTAADDSARASARRRVQAAKEGLGERGTPWWDLTGSEGRRRAQDRLSQVIELENELSTEPPSRHVVDGSTMET